MANLRDVFRALILLFALVYTQNCPPVHFYEGRKWKDMTFSHDIVSDEDYVLFTWSNVTNETRQIDKYTIIKTEKTNGSAISTVYEGICSRFPGSPSLLPELGFFLIGTEDSGFMLYNSFDNPGTGIFVKPDYEKICIGFSPCLINFFGFVARFLKTPNSKIKIISSDYGAYLNNYLELGYVTTLDFTINNSVPIITFEQLIIAQFLERNMNFGYMVNVHKDHFVVSCHSKNYTEIISYNESISSNSVLVITDAKDGIKASTCKLTDNYLGCGNGLFNRHSIHVYNSQQNVLVSEFHIPIDFLVNECNYTVVMETCYLDLSPTIDNNEKFVYLAFVNVLKLSSKGIIMVYDLSLNNVVALLDVMTFDGPIYGIIVLSNEHIFAIPYQYEPDGKIADIINPNWENDYNSNLSLSSFCRFLIMIESCVSYSLCHNESFQCIPDYCDSSVSCANIIFEQEFIINTMNSLSEVQKEEHLNFLQCSYYAYTSFKSQFDFCYTKNTTQSSEINTTNTCEPSGILISRTKYEVDNSSFQAYTNSVLYQLPRLKESIFTGINKFTLQVYFQDIYGNKGVLVGDGIVLKSLQKEGYVKFCSERILSKQENYTIIDFVEIEEFSIARKYFEIEIESNMICAKIDKIGNYYPAYLDINENEASDLDVLLVLVITFGSIFVVIAALIIIILIIIVLVKIKNIIVKRFGKLRIEISENNILGGL